MRIFKSKSKPDTTFTTLEVSVGGVSYGYFCNWFRRDIHGNLVEIKSSDLPKEVLNWRIENIVEDAQRDFNKSIVDLKDEFKNKINEKLDLFNEVINEIKNDTIGVQ